MHAKLGALQRQWGLISEKEAVTLLETHVGTPAGWRAHTDAHTCAHTDAHTRTPGTSARQGQQGLGGRARGFFGTREQPPLLFRAVPYRDVPC